MKLEKIVACLSRDERQAVSQMIRFGKRTKREAFALQVLKGKCDAASWRSAIKVPFNRRMCDKYRTYAKAIIMGAMVKTGLECPEAAPQPRSRNKNGSAMVAARVMFANGDYAGCIRTLNRFSMNDVFYFESRMLEIKALYLMGEFPRASEVLGNVVASAGRRGDNAVKAWCKAMRGVLDGRVDASDVTAANDAWFYSIAPVRKAMIWLLFDLFLYPDKVLALDFYNKLEANEDKAIGILFSGMDNREKAVRIYDLVGVDSGFPFNLRNWLDGIFPPVAKDPAKISGNPDPYPVLKRHAILFFHNDGGAIHLSPDHDGASFTGMACFGWYLESSDRISDCEFPIDISTPVETPDGAFQIRDMGSSEISTMYWMHLMNHSMGMHIADEFEWHAKDQKMRGDYEKAHLCHEKRRKVIAGLPRTCYSSK